MKQSVSAIFICEDQVLIMKRQNYLRAFPGYSSFPGGKVDEEDVVNGGDDYLLFALKREIQEELHINIDELLKSEHISDVKQYALAVTPDFNPHRFENYYFKVFVKDKKAIDEIAFHFDEGEIAKATWMNCHEAFTEYKKGHLLVVPPMITILKDLDRDINSVDFLDANLKYDGEKQVPMIEPLFGLRQYMPLSHTFPPANRTNCFVIGDDNGKKIVIDPSPKNEKELDKLIYGLKEHRLSEIFLTHHHPDHHEFSRELAKKLSLPFSMSKGTYEHLLEDFGQDYFEGHDVKFYKDGDIITTSCGHDVKLVTTGGHAFGQSSLLRADGSWMIVSDLIQTIGTVTISGRGSDMREYFQSLNHVINLNPQVVMPSHGICLGGTNKIKQTLDHRIERENQIRACLEEGKSREEIFQSIYPDLPDRLHKYAYATIDSHLNKLEEFGPGLC
ncbi:MBL fold metallo-hydrolase [Halobacteriovorax sp. RZ-1]|uniref:MBL fold metallo-hydrolase n=1 Tax=unclassified Halobacteriovorax TaxID=2639665 RepID=UPI00371E3D31